MLLASLPLIVGLSVPSPLDLDEAAPEPEVTRPRTRAVTHLALGPWVAAPAIHERGPIAPGMLTELDVGVQRSWLWLGATGGWGLFPSRDFSAHSLTAGGFAGVRPRVRSLWISSRIGVSAGSVIARSSRDIVRRPVATGHLRVGFERAPDGAEHVRFGFFLGLDISSRRTSFSASSGDGIGLGRARGGVLFTVAWDGAGRALAR